MSWGASASQRTAYELFETLDESFNQFFSEAHTSVRAQFETAKDVVNTLLGVVDGEYYNCSIGGHSQEADPNSSTDYVNISLSATAAPTEV